MKLFNCDGPIINYVRCKYNYMVNKIYLINIFFLFCFSDFILLPGFIDFVAGDVVSLYLLSTTF